MKTSTRQRSFWPAALLWLMASSWFAGIAFAGSEADEITTVIQLGDSYSAGFGLLPLDTPAPDDQSHCDDPSYFVREITPGYRLANLVWEQTGAAPQFVFEACGGAQVYNDGNFNLGEQWEEAKAGVEDLDTGEGAVIVMTFGGNDVRTRAGLSWVELVEACIKESDPFGGCDDNRLDNEIGNIEELYDALVAELINIANDVPNAKIRFLGYPLPFQPVLKHIIGLPGVIAGGVIRSCPGMTLLSEDEADFLDGQTHLLNFFLANAVDYVRETTEVDIAFVDVEGLFRGHGACNAFGVDAFINDVDWIPFPLPPQVHANSLHPLLPGWNAYFAALRSNMGL